MIRQHKKMILLTSIITLFPIFIGLLLWNQLPDSLATHWGINNEPNGYASKTFAVFGLPLIMLLGHAVSVIAMNIDPKVKNISEKVYFVILWIIPLLSLFICNVLYGYNLGFQLDMGFLCGLMIGVFYLILGNFIPKVKPNYTIGFRISWALCDPIKEIEKLSRLCFFISKNVRDIRRKCNRQFSVVSVEQQFCSVPVKSCRD